MKKINRKEAKKLALLMIISFTNYFWLVHLLLCKKNSQSSWAKIITVLGLRQSACSGYVCLFLKTFHIYINGEEKKRTKILWRTIHNINGRLLARLERTRIMIKFASWFAFEWFSEYKFEMVDLFITSVVPRSCRLLNGRRLEKTPEDNNLIKGQVWTRGPKKLFLKFVVFFGNSCLKTFSFLAKKLRKNTGAQNTHALFFFILFFLFIETL